MSFQEVNKLFCPALPTGMMLENWCKNLPVDVKMTCKPFSLRKTTLDPFSPASVSGGKLSKYLVSTL